MNIGEEIVLLDEEITIQIKSKFPAGQGYMPRIIKDTHYSIMLNGTQINLPEKGLQTLIDILVMADTKNKEILKQIHNKEEENPTPCLAVDENELTKEDFEELREAYYKKFGSSVPNRMKNDIEWIKAKINE